MAEAKDEKVVKLVDTRGATVTVRESKADRLKKAGYKTPAQAAKAVAEPDASDPGKTD